MEGKKYLRNAHVTEHLPLKRYNCFAQSAEAVNRWQAGENVNYLWALLVRFSGGGSLGDGQGQGHDSQTFDDSSSRS